MLDKGRSPVTRRVANIAARLSAFVPRNRGGTMQNRRIAGHALHVPCNAAVGMNYRCRMQRASPRRNSPDIIHARCMFSIALLHMLPAVDRNICARHETRFVRTQEQDE